MTNTASAQGASNIREFLPGDNSAVVAADFESPEALAKYLLSVDQNDDAYMEYFAWKTRPLSRNFSKHLDRCVFQSECRICEYYRKVYSARKQAKPPIETPQTDTHSSWERHSQTLEEQRDNLDAST